jgi:23S rRNA (cytosine1962-C5)-methyltransferase
VNREAAPTCVVTHRAEQRLRAGHVWLYRGDVVQADARPGDIVSVVGPRRRTLGTALYSSQSAIALRLLQRGASDLPASFWRDRLVRAIAYRDRLAIDATAYRLVHAEADLLPSLIVDRYGDYLAVQALSQGIDRRLPSIVDTLGELMRPAGILARNDPRVRELEGLERDVELLAGSVPDEVVVREGALEYGVDLRRGQKTGLFLDQRENREMAGRYARGRALDGFSYQGGFALQLARGAASVVALESSAEAVSTLEANARRNGITNVEAREANVFDALRELERGAERFDTIVLDPPAFAKSKAAVPRATAGYKEINLRAMKLLQPGGVLITCTCSHHIGEPLFLDVVRAAAADAQARVTLVEKRMQARDHPVLLGVPETHYLTCLVLRRLV